MRNALLIVAIATALSACGNDTPQDVQQQQPAPAAQAPAVVQQGGSDAGDMLAAGAIGMMAGQALANRQPAQYHPGYSQSYNSRPVVKNKTVIVQKNVIVQRKVSLTKSPSRSSFSRGGRR